MSISSFLFEGNPPPSTTTYSTSTSSIPQWLSDYQQGLVARANQIAAEPYQTYTGPRIAPLGTDVQNAFDMTRTAAGAYQSPLTQALGLTQQAIAPGQGGLAAATPYMQAASQNFPGAVQQYMNPYISNVIDRAKLEANRNFQENILPTLQSKFTASGQYGSSAMQREADRAARDLTEGLQSQAASQLATGYGQAGQLFGQDVGRQAQLAQLAGQLGGQQTQQQLAGAQQLAGLGAQSQALGLQGAGALSTIGQIQQTQQQKNLDLAYQDFLNQTQYPRQTTDWLANIIKGVPAPVSTAGTKTGPAEVYGPSGLEQLGSLATGALGLYKAWQEAHPQTGSTLGQDINSSYGSDAFQQALDQSTGTDWSTLPISSDAGQT